MAGAQRTATCTKFGDRLLKVSVAGLTADGDYSSEIDVETEMLNACLIYGYPKSVTMQVSRTAGTTDVVEVNLHGSNITAIYGNSTGGDDTSNILSCVSSEGSDPVGETDLDPYRYFEVMTQTLGATTNTLTATVVFQWGP